MRRGILPPPRSYGSPTGPAKKLYNLCIQISNMRTRIIGIVSGKGGVGKTTTTTNIGASLAKVEKNTILVDGNLTTPNLSIHLGIPFYPYTLHEVLEGKIEIEDAIFYHKHGLKVIPSSISIKALRNLNIRNFGRVIRDLEGRAEYVLIDSSPGLGKETQTVIENSDEVIVVANPDLPAVTDALKVVKLAESMGTEIAGIIVNKVKNRPHELSIEEIEEILENPVIGVVPEDDKVNHAVLRKIPVTIAYPKTKASRAFYKIASEISGEKVYEETLIDKIRDVLGL